MQEIKGELTDKINVMNSKIDELTSRLEQQDPAAVENLEIPSQANVTAS